MLSIIRRASIEVLRNELIEDIQKEFQDQLREISIVVFSETAKFDIAEKFSEIHGSCLFLRFPFFEKAIRRYFLGPDEILLGHEMLRVHLLALLMQKEVLEECSMLRSYMKIGEEGDLPLVRALRLSMLLSETILDLQYHHPDFLDQTVEPDQGQNDLHHDLLFLYGLLFDETHAFKEKSGNAKVVSLLTFRERELKEVSAGPLFIWNPSPLSKTHYLLLQKLSEKLEVRLYHRELTSPDLQKRLSHAKKLEGVEKILWQWKKPELIAESYLAAAKGTRPAKKPKFALNTNLERLQACLYSGSKEVSPRKSVSDGTVRIIETRSLANTALYLRYEIRRVLSENPGQKWESIAIVSPQPEKLAPFLSVYAPEIPFHFAGVPLERENAFSKAVLLLVGMFTRDVRIGDVEELFANPFFMEYGGYSREELTGMREIFQSHSVTGRKKEESSDAHSWRGSAARLAIETFFEADAVWYRSIAYENLLPDRHGAAVAYLDFFQKVESAYSEITRSRNFDEGLSLLHRHLQVFFPNESADWLPAKLQSMFSRFEYIRILDERSIPFNPQLLHAYTREMIRGNDFSRGAGEGAILVTGAENARSLKKDFIFLCDMEEGVWPGQDQRRLLQPKESKADTNFGSSDRNRLLFHEILMVPSKGIYLLLGNDDLTQKDRVMPNSLISDLMVIAEEASIELRPTPVPFLPEEMLLQEFKACPQAIPIQERKRHLQPEVHFPQRKTGASAAASQVEKIRISYLQKFLQNPFKALLARFGIATQHEVTLEEPSVRWTAYKLADHLEELWVSKMTEVADEKNILEHYEEYLERTGKIPAAWMGDIHRKTLREEFKKLGQKFTENEEILLPGEFHFIRHWLVGEGVVYDDSCRYFEACQKGSWEIHGAVQNMIWIPSENRVLKLLLVQKRESKHGPWELERMLRELLFVLLHNQVARESQTIRKMTACFYTLDSYALEPVEVDLAKIPADYLDSLIEDYRNTTYPEYFPLKSFDFSTANIADEEQYFDRAFAEIENSYADDKDEHVRFLKPAIPDDIRPLFMRRIYPLLKAMGKEPRPLKSDAPGDNGDKGGAS